MVFAALEDQDVYLPMEMVMDGILIGVSLNGTLHGNVDGVLSNGVLGQALSLNGHNQSVDLGNQRHTCFGSRHLCPESITAALWIKVEGQSTGKMFILHMDGSARTAHGL